MFGKYSCFTAKLYYIVMGGKEKKHHQNTNKSLLLASVYQSSCDMTSRMVSMSPKRGF